MAQVLMPAAFLSALVAGAVAMTGNAPEDSPYSTSQDFSFMQKIPTASDWVFANEENNSICIVSKARRVTASTSLIEADATCESVFPDIDLVSVWQQDKDGYVTFADDHGIAIAEFSWDQEKGFVSISGEPGKYALTPGS